MYSYSRRNLKEKNQIKDYDESKEELFSMFDEIEYSILPKFREGAKTPVLFFDEVTRGEKSVRQALTKIFSDKEFMGYGMKKARVIAATNSAGDDMEDIFLTKSVDDVAFFDRFESMFITPEDAFPGWKQWAKLPSSKFNGANIHRIVMDVIADNLDVAYNMSELVRRYEDTGDINEITFFIFSKL